MLGHRALLCLIAGVVIDAAPAGGPLHPSRSHAHAEPHSHAHAAHLTHHTTLPGAHLPAAAWQRAEPLPLNHTRLTAGSVFADAQALNSRYLKYLDLDRLLYMFRQRAGLPTGTDNRTGAPVRPYGGWESPNYVNGLINGHFTGHLLSALAFDAAATGDAETSRKGDELVAELAKCQAAVAARNASRAGWLSAYGIDHLERLEAHNTTEVWAPYYTLHKIMAGLLDQHLVRGSALALSVLESLAAYVYKRIVALRAAKGAAWWEECLETEFGGMNELGYNLYAVTGDTTHRELGDLFYKQSFMDPLAAGVDSLNGRHANCHLPEVVGVARGWEVTANATLANITANFHAILGGRYEYATGGSNVNEHWSSPGQLGDAIATSFDEDTGAPHNSNGFHTEETCTQYNALKMLRHLFRWSPSARIADDYETKLLNGIVGVQQPGVVGSMSYMTPLGRGVNRNKWDWYGFGNANNSFWCCYGSTIEQFAKLADSVYFRGAADSGSERGTNATLIVAQFMPSTLRWPETGVSLTQATHVRTLSAAPSEAAGGAVAAQDVELTIDAAPAPPGTFNLKLRVPAWAAAGSTLESRRAGANATEVHVAPGTFAEVPPPRTDGWRPGDSVHASFRMAPQLRYINDARAEYANVAAIQVGPYVLGGLTDEDNTIDADPAKVAEWVVPSGGGGSAVPPPGVAAGGLQLVAVGASKNYTLVALNRLVLANYTVYFNVSGTGASQLHSG